MFFAIAPPSDHHIKFKDMDDLTGFSDCAGWVNEMGAVALRIRGDTS